MKRVILYLGLMLGSYAHSQTEIISIKEDLKWIEETFNAVDESTGNFALFMRDRNHIGGKLFDEKGNQIAEVSVPVPPEKFVSFIGYEFDAQKINLFVYTVNGIVYRLKYDFSEETGSCEELDFKYKDEIRIHTANYNGHLHVFTITKNSNSINCYAINESVRPELHVIDFDDTEFLNKSEKSENLYNFMEDSDFLNTSFVVDEVEEGVPNALETTSKHSKFYNEVDQVLLSLDKNSNFTYLIRIDLKDFKKSLERIDKPKLANNRKTSTTNSFLSDGKLYQIVATSNAMVFQIIDIQDNNKVLKTLNFSNDSDIDFKNTPIIQKDLLYDKYREIEKTSKFLRKINKWNLGISVYKENNIEQLTIGGSYSRPESRGARYITVGSGSLSLSPNPVWPAYTSYIKSESIYFTGLFDKNYNHLEGDVSQNPFDKIKAFADTQENIKIETAFELNGEYYWGARFVDLDEYKIYKF